MNNNVMAYIHLAKEKKYYKGKKVMPNTATHKWYRMITSSERCMHTTVSTVVVAVVYTFTRFNHVLNIDICTNTYLNKRIIYRTEHNVYLTLYTDIHT